MIRSTNTASNKIDINRTYKQSHHRIKPNGLWYGIDGSWEEWLESSWENGYKEFGKNNNFEIDVDQSRLLIIDSIYKLRELPLSKSNSYSYIDWDLLYIDYGGVEFMHIHTFNFYSLESRPFSPYALLAGSLDCNSGCIWDLSAINKFQCLNGL